MLMCQSGVHFPKPQLSQVPSTGLATIVANNAFGKHTLGRVILYVNVTIISKDQEICDFYLFSLNYFYIWPLLKYIVIFVSICDWSVTQWLDIVHEWPQGIFLTLKNKNKKNNKRQTPKENKSPLVVT